jgi:glycosyltransferase involved in cell wall biosynthesis
MPFLLLMPSYNQAHYIAEAVRSVLAQTDPDWELWILDNSGDRTPEVMRRFDDARIRFHHIPQRMDPGSCLNWLMERAQGEAFSYVHTDNNLRPDYVSRMRAALVGKAMGLAYCDLRLIDDDGTATSLFHRGAFDLARLFSLDTLGVPFAATTALARAIGGFRANDLADDVRFCVSAYGRAEYVHVRQPLLDYRMHEQSRSTSEGWPKVRQSFLDLFLEMRPQLVARGVADPVPALARAVVERFEDLEWFFEDLWYRKLSRVLDPWWREGPVIEHLFQAGLVRVPGFSGLWPKPRLRPVIRDRDGRIAAWPWSVYTAAAYRSLRRHDIWRLAEKIQQVLLPWAYLTLGGHAERICVADAGFRSLLSGRLLEYALKWQPVVPAGVAFPGWIGWSAASGREPRLQVGDLPHLATDSGR